MRHPRLSATLATLALAACSTGPKHIAAPTGVPHLAPPPPAALDWRDQPLSPGSWRYDPQASSAAFGVPGTTPDVTLRCDKVSRTVTLARTGAHGALTVRTSYGSRTLAAGATALAATDPLLDQIAFSRGRFSIESAGLSLVMVPAWAEPGRVVEDCRAPA